MSELQKPLLLSKKLDIPIRIALIQQVLIAFLCLLALDFGVSARICASALVGFWAGVLFLVVRRHATPTSTDLVFVRWGFIPVLLVSLLLGRLWISWH